MAAPAAPGRTGAQERGVTGRGAGGAAGGGPGPARPGVPWFCPWVCIFTCVCAVLWPTAAGRHPGTLIRLPPGTDHVQPREAWAPEPRHPPPATRLGRAWASPLSRRAAASWWKALFSFCACDAAKLSLDSFQSGERQQRLPGSAVAALLTQLRPDNSERSAGMSLFKPGARVGAVSRGAVASVRANDL